MPLAKNLKKDWFARSSLSFLQKSVALFSLFATVLFAIAGKPVVQFKFLDFGPQAWLMAATPLLMAVAFFARPRRERERPGFRPFLPRLGLVELAIILLFIWMVGHWINFALISDRNISGLQTVFSATLLTTGILFFFRVPFEPYRLHAVISLSAGLGAALTVFDWISGGSVFFDAQVTLYLLIPLISSLVVASNHPSFLFVTLLIFLAILAPAPRIAIVGAIVVLSLGLVLSPRISALARSVTALATCTLLAYFYFFAESFRERWLEPGDAGLALPEAVSQVLGNSGPVFLNTHGRTNVWGALLETVTVRTWLMGNGAGHSRSFVSDYAGWQQPHNEYLRILVDFGLPSLVIYLVAMALLFIFAIKRWRVDPALAFGIVAAMIVLALLSLTDLPLVSFGFVLPLTLVLGSSLSTLSRENRPGDRLKTSN